MSSVAIKVENISKRYQIGDSQSYLTLRDKLVELPSQIFKGPKKNKEFWALRGVSFEVKKGEVIGIMGRNGAGKSTLLKILARITEPTRGTITMHGRVASMLEVGTGFNPELTGRENIYLNGAIIGMTKKEIKAQFTAIVEFSGISKFLDTPVKHYSSGMYVRLAFAVAAHLDSDILLVDEVLAVGDAEFQRKCLRKMTDLARSGRTVIFVSHSSSSIAQLCDKTILIEGGKITAMGKTQTIINKYINSLEARKLAYIHKNNPKQAISLRKVNVVTSSSDNIVYYDEAFKIKIMYDINEPVDNCTVWLALQDSEGLVAFTSSDYDEDESMLGRRTKGSYTSTLEIPGKLLNLSTYTVIVGIVKNSPLVVYAREEVLRFQVALTRESSRTVFLMGPRRGVVQPILHWSVTKT